MFIRASSQLDIKTKKVYTTYRLVESYRNQESKVRQQTLINLGCHFNIPKHQWKALANRIEEIERGQQTLLEIEPSLEKEARRITKRLTRNRAEIIQKTKTPSQTENDFQTVDVNTLEHRDIRKIGPEHVAYHAACQLKLEELLINLGFNKKQAHIALGTVIGRLVHPASDLSTHRYLTEYSALDELLGTDFSNLPLKQFYQIADQLYKHKSKIENRLYQREKDLFNLEEVVTLYDITNTYFEGRCDGHSQACHGRSKEKRSDCCLVALGMVLDGSGFPKKSKIFPGNVSEPKTLQAMLGVLDASEKTTVVLDAGIATKDNVAWLKESGYEYIVINKKRNLAMPEQVDSVIVKEDKNNVVRTCLVKNEVTNELELYCHSEAKEKKSHQMITKFECRYELELQKLSDGLHKKGCTKKYEKILERLGRLKERYKKVAQYYNVIVDTDEKNKQAILITWKKKDPSEDNQIGVYCLKTNKSDLDEVTFWKIYTMLTDLEAAFRCLKSELGFRPVYHQKESRINAHLFISILAYHLLHTIRYQLKMNDINSSWKTLLRLLDSQCRITSTLRLKNGQVIHIRKTSSPDSNQEAIYKALAIASHPGKTEKVYL